MQKGARSFANFLGVKKMAGILLGDADWKRSQSCGEAESGEEFGDVARLSGKFACLAVLFPALREEMMIFLERGAAAGDWPVPESGTTVMDCCGAPLVKVPLCWSTKLPVRPWSVPVIRSMAT